MQLLNGQGQLLRDIHPTTQTQQVEISTRDLPNGLYWLRIRSGKEWYTKELLKIE